MNNQAIEKQENVLAGAVGAFLFGLAGAAVWVVLDLVGFMAGLSGLVGVICAMQGYKVFGGKLSRKGVIIAAVIAILILVLAWYGCFAKDLYQAYKEWYANGEVDFMPTYFDCVRNGFRFFQEGEIAKDYLLSLLIGLGLALLGSYRYIINAFRGATETKPVQEEPLPVQNDPYAVNPDEYRPAEPQNYNVNYNQTNAPENKQEGGQDAPKDGENLN